MTRTTIKTVLVTAAATLAVAGPAQADERLTVREARAAVAATTADPVRGTDLAKAIAFVRSDVGSPTSIDLADAERIGAHRIRFDAAVSYRSTATGTTLVKSAPVTIVRRSSGRLIARSTVVLPDGDAFTVGASFRLETER